MMLRWFNFSALLILPILFFSGCKPSKIRAEQREFFRYCAESDRFEYLTIFQDIRMEDESECAAFYDFYSQRDTMIIGHDMGMLLKVSDTQYRRYALGEMLNDTVCESEYSLNDIFMASGELMLDAKGSLCYAHRISVPGWMVDSKLDRSVHWIYPLTDTDIEHFYKEVCDTSKTLTWDKVMEGDCGGIPIEKMPFSAETRKMVCDYVVSGKIDYWRRGTMVYVNCPMTSADADALIAWEKHMHLIKDTAWMEGCLSFNKIDTGIVAVFDMLAKAQLTQVKCPIAAAVEPVRTDDGICKNELLITYLRNKGVAIVEGFDAVEEMNRFFSAPALTKGSKEP